MKSKSKLNTDRTTTQASMRCCFAQWRALVIGAVVALGMVGACAADPLVQTRPADAAADESPPHATPAARPAVTIAIKDFVFSPQAVTVAKGGTVTWKNQDGEPHTVRGAEDLIRSDALDQDDSYSVRFDQPGTYRYGCSIHPMMSGTIVVR